jgi:hypothetical protein
MNYEESEIWKEKEIAATNYRSKLRNAREQKGLTIHEAAQSIISIGQYYDIEECERDFTYCYSLIEITEVCKILGIHPRDLFCDTISASTSISEIIDRIKTHCTEKQISIGEFEDITGWQVENCLTNPAKALEEWDVDCLMDVCRELDIDWRCVIAGL